MFRPHKEPPPKMEGLEAHVTLSQTVGQASAFSGNEGKGVALPQPWRRTKMLPLAELELAGKGYGDAKFGHN